MATTEKKYVTEVPSSLKQLTRLVARIFYSIEDALIIDMLVRNLCMKEHDLAELLRYEEKQLRSRIYILRNDKFIQMRLTMETSADGKAHKVNYYFINYKSFVNVVKHKLDFIRNRMEKEEHDATNLSNLKCISCDRTFTDLEVDKIFDVESQEFRCTYCGDPVEEDTTAMPKKDRKLMLARFSDQLEPLYELLRATEGIKLDPKILEPEPVNINTIRGFSATKLSQRIDNQQSSGEAAVVCEVPLGGVERYLNIVGDEWFRDVDPPVLGIDGNGEAARNQRFILEETRIDINLEQDLVETTSEKKSKSVCMTKSTNQNESNVDLIVADTVTNDSSQSSVLQPTISSRKSYNRNKNDTEDKVSLLLLYEKQHVQKDQFSKDLKFGSSNPSGSSDKDRDIENTEIPDIDQHFIVSNSEDNMPTVLAGGKSYPIN